MGHLPQTRVEHSIKPARLCCVAIFGIVGLATVIVQEMMRLPQHRTKAPHLPHQPLHHLEPLVRAKKAAVLLGQINHDRAALHEGDALFVIDNRRDLIVGADLQKLRRELIACTNIHRDGLIRQAQFFQQDRHFAPIWRGPRIEIDHCRGPSDGLMCRHPRPKTRPWAGKSPHMAKC